MGEKQLWPPAKSRSQTKQVSMSHRQNVHLLQYSIHAQNPSYCQSKFYIAGIGIPDLLPCDLDLNPITFIHEPEPHPIKI